MTKKIPLYIRSLDVDEGYTIKTTNDLITWLCYRDWTVSYEAMAEAVSQCATELGCIYENVYELEADIQKYFI